MKSHRTLYKANTPSICRGPYVIGDIFSRGEITVLAGDTGTGRSWLMLQLAGEIAAGLPRLGVFSAVPRRILYLNCNSPTAAYRNRLCGPGWQQRYGTGAKNWIYYEPAKLELDTGAGADETGRLARSSQAEVVVADCLWSMTTGADSTSVQLALRACNRLCNSLGISFIFGWFVDSQGCHDKHPRILHEEAVNQYADTIIAVTLTGCRRRITFLKSNTGFYQLDFSFHPGTAVPYRPESYPELVILNERRCHYAQSSGSAG